MKYPDSTRPRFLAILLTMPRVQVGAAGGGFRSEQMAVEVVT